jgi:hypothetical protein
MRADYSIATVWVKANAAVCVVRGFLYLVPYATTKEYQAYQGAFGGVALSPSETQLSYAVDAGWVIAFALDLRIK